ncbi:prokaryotic molybdopterin-containing oxidoreductase family, molybdopterin binding subunit [Thermanaeromonas toyohensis ToBE]|uniref:Prokaryotic molybdopterin-containing oxidoreductase family, molybdopterin binding subunit n=1 Tax=Thermanaeromonas toyohensis ToBE TaxID=698762 RepID=A0A1W1VD94_9FIRM|nr:molybdopterin-dependent oxidoreductase [Thermanaeromonas toyohensis]SMB91286.1 prokaryotic molybdopterin-containing oxidoreductase family, molybdopterin binding subunit [Thermanaeromonas toyohensis ToBE]
MSGRISRRTFLKGAAVLAATSGVSWSATKAYRWLSPAEAAPLAREEKVVRTVCSPNCWQTCNHLVTVREGKVVKIAPAPMPDPEYNRICLRGLTHIQRLYHPDRLKYPMRRIGERGEGKWERISWDEALDFIAGKFKELRDKYGPQAIAVVHQSGNYGLLNGGYGGAYRFAGVLESVLASGSVDQAVSIGFSSALGTGIFDAYSNECADWVNARTIILWGSACAESQINEWHFIWEAVEKGAHLVVIDPIYTTTAQKAHTWVNLRPGTDIAFALGLLHVIITRGLVDKEFTLNKTCAPFLVREDNRLFLRQGEKPLVWDTRSGRAVPYDTPSIVPALEGLFEVNGVKCATVFSLLKTVVQDYSPAKVAEITGVSPEVVVKVATLLATNRPGGIKHGYGADRYHHADLLGQAMITLLGLTGNIGKSGNILGIFFAGFDPMVYNVNWLFPRGTFPKMLPLVQLQDTVIKQNPYPIKAFYITCSNLLVQTADRNRWLREVWPKLELVVAVDQFFNNTLNYADIVLPAAHYYETEEIVLSGDVPYVLYRQKVIEPLWEARPDWEIYRGIASRLGLGQYFGSIEEECAKWLDMPLMRQQGIDYQRLKKEQAIRFLPKPYIPWQDGKFKTPTGRLEFYLEKKVPQGEELPVFKWPLEAGPDSPQAAKYPLILITRHEKFRIHSQYENQPWLREINPEPFVDLNPQEARKRGIGDGDLVEVFNDRGHVTLRCRYNEAIPPGVAHIQQGWWFYRDGHHQELTHARYKENTLNYSFFDVRVEVKKA